MYLYFFNNNIINSGKITDINGNLISEFMDNTLKSKYTKNIESKSNKIIKTNTIKKKDDINNLSSMLTILNSMIKLMDKILDKR